MNWLSHLYLSEPDPAFRIGNLLPDLAPISALGGLRAEFVRGMEQHRRIDAFTDSHAIFRRSVARVGPEFRRYGGILVDIFYDHFLTREWPALCDVPLEQFTGEVYASFETYRHEIPPEAFWHLERMKSANWLCSYGDLEGVRLTLRRLSERLRKPVPLANAVVALEADYAGFHADFTAFFPELISMCRIRNEL
jgi:acyl carrier protein phosphodiesterase